MLSRIGDNALIVFKTDTEMVYEHVSNISQIMHVPVLHILEKWFTALILFISMMQNYIYRFTCITRRNNWCKSEIYNTHWKASADGKQVEKKSFLKIVMNLADLVQLLSVILMFCRKQQMNLLKTASLTQSNNFEATTKCQIRSYLILTLNSQYIKNVFIA